MSSLLELSDQELSERLASVIQKLDNFTHVNRKAWENCDLVIHEQDNLLEQRGTLYKAEDVINRLISNLDQQKDSTLLKTFENVNTQFFNVFGQLVPGGKGKLLLKKIPKETVVPGAIDSLQDDDLLLNQKDTSSALIPTGEKVIGVDIKVQFPTSQDYVTLDRLSGGQRSTVALALLFSLQRVEAAPFYVLDEVDAHLDTQYLGGVAQLMQNQAAKHQIIVISHKEPMIKAGSWFLKTEMEGISARVTPTSLEDALASSQALKQLGDTLPHGYSQPSSAITLTSQI